ncbi:MAG TPA: aminomethyl-transferring glycine dehydrogenase [Acidimicrobiales bacterium]|nr:aminomethyl-transferring glycine dehydrogenase [Acidimicrobiales bacterium]
MPAPSTPGVPGARPLRTLAELATLSPFARRHIGPSPGDAAAMLAELGYDDVEALIDEAVPGAIRSSRPLELPPALAEHEVLGELRRLAERNETWISLVGTGYSNTITPPVIQRNVLENPAWYTAYTPYQPEISQGRLEALLNFQTMVSDLTGLEVANASLLDEATAAAEAMTMCRRLVAGEGGTFLVDPACHPQTIEVLETRARPLGLTVAVGDPAAAPDVAGVFGVLVQYPGSDGELRDVAGICARAHETGALAVVAADLLALTLISPPGELGADIAVGSSQRFGVPLWFGGPHAAYIATRAAHERSLPGRLVGVSIDAEGRPALRLALQTREQHIRRERATSNICTAQALLAVVAGLYAAYHGPEGLRAIAERVHRLTVVLAEGLRRGGHHVRTGRFFDTIQVEVGDRAAAIVEAAAAQRVNLRRVDERTLGISLDETTTPAVVTDVWSAFGLPAGSVDQLDREATSPLDAGVLRTSAVLTHPVFNRYHSETEMLRYVRALSDKDLALDRSMIPLGSCTMKLNAAAEMAAVSWPAFTDVHPFAPLAQAAGYLRIIEDLERWLAEITGYDAVSLQPNAGSQGELTGLLAIRRYHEERGEKRRDLCLIPTSAHGTNAASAAMAGLRIVAVACDDRGNVDLADLRAKLDRHHDELAAMMITYPSTHGVYEEGIAEVCATVHEAGGQVYIDGANLNALVGLVRLAEIGGDVSHVNLHKTFCIPHGGGGPGVGPVGARAHLAPYLPGSRLVPDARPDATGGAVAAAPFGSPGVLPISWAYIRLMGAEGLTSATKSAVLAANYVAHRLAPHYPVLYTGASGRVAHECILDLRGITARTAISAEDVAKRLIDYGFHAPTMSFPVAGTLMVEPTESEPKSELDRFCEAMIAIRAEIAEVETGRLEAKESPLPHAPHTAEAVTAEKWEHRYSRDEAAFPSVASRARKYWSPVARVDNAYGDRHVVCTCPPLEELAEHD